MLTKSYLIVAALTIAQAQPAFDPVSIKPYVPSGTVSEACNSHGDPALLVLVGCTLGQLAQMAYDVKHFQVLVKAPDWVETDRYMIEARAPAPTSRPEMMRMLQPVLAARFHMSVRWDDRQAPAYLLQTAKHGLKLQAAVKTDHCGSLFVRDGIVKSDCLTLDDVAEELQSLLAHPVVNRTGSRQDARFEFHLEYPSAEDPSIAIPSALPDLGLVLKAGKAPLRTLVIERARRPDAN